MIKLIFGFKLPNYNPRYIPIEFSNAAKPGVGTHFIGVNIVFGGHNYCEFPEIDMVKINKKYEDWKTEQLKLLVALQQQTVGITQKEINGRFRYVDKIINLLNNEKPKLIAAQTGVN